MAPKQIGIVTVVGILIAAGLLYFLSKMGQEENVSWNERDQEAIELKKEQEALSKEIKTLAGDNLCRTDGDCDVVGLGAETCGGYTKFLIFSMFDSGDDKPLLRQKVKRFNEIATRLHHLSFKVKSCGFKPDPVRCIQKRCVQVTVEKN